MRKKLMLALVMASSLAVVAQTADEFTMVNYRVDNPKNTPEPVHPLPHPRQVKWMQTEFYAFFHYGMNTFTGQEWGNGDEDINRYAPTATPNPRQWLETARKAKMNGGIAVVKHHDGFCLWPTNTTNHSIKSLPAPANYDIAQGFAEAALEMGMKYGFYVSPWDRNSEFYGDGTDAYVTNVFLKQCEELAKYGSGENGQFEMWFDGANGGSGYYGGHQGNRSIDRATYYDTPNLRYMVHQTHPDCVLWGVGGEARWIGNEAGWAGTTNWCTDNREDGKDQSNPTQGNENGWFWLPGESDAKATTKGWFWHENEGVKSVDELFKMYLETVGRNATFILNLPPDKSGSLPEATVTRMEQLGQRLTERLGTNFCKEEGVSVTTNDVRTGGYYEPENLIDERTDTYFATNDGVETAEIVIQLAEEKTIHYVMLQEYIPLGQRVKAFTIETSTDNVNWQSFGGSIPTTTIGYKRIIPQSGDTNNYGAGVRARYVRVNITNCKSVPVIQNIAVY